MGVLAWIIDRRPTSSSAVQRRLRERISLAGHDRTRREDEDNGAGPNEDGGLLIGVYWRRFHSQINRNVTIGFRCSTF